MRGSSRNSCDCRATFPLRVNGIVLKSVFTKRQGVELAFFLAPKATGADPVGHERCRKK
jgi:hypothetical protein